MIYEVVPVQDGMIGGHYAVKSPDGSLIGKDFGLDFTRANSLSTALNSAFKSGQDSLGEPMERAIGR